jgi:dolichyl-phosphate beta-glucosyltransferase
MTQTRDFLDFSIVIPAYNESAKITRDVEEAAAFLAGQNLASEVIVTDDGSTDGTADKALRARVPEGRVRLRVIRMDHNSGKGGAVKRGVLASRGAVVLVADSGTCIPYADALRVIQNIRDDHLDIGLASRRHRETVIHRNRSLKRRLLSRFFHLAARILAGLPRSISDSQCGFKVYRGEAARQLFSECRTTGYLFELEILLRAFGRGLRVEEFPVAWTCDPDTRLKPAADAPRVLKDLLRIKKIVRGGSRKP